MARQPAGLGTSRWQEFARQLWATEFRGQPCFFCECPIIRGLGEIEHRISPSIAPELAWSPWWRGEPFLVPVHGGGKRRCSNPACDLDCNAIAAGNHAPRDELGRSARWSDEFLARKRAERAAFRAGYRTREGRSSVTRHAAPAREPVAAGQRNGAAGWQRTTTWEQRHAAAEKGRAAQVGRREGVRASPLPPGREPIDVNAGRPWLTLRGIRGIPGKSRPENSLSVVI